jgi:hypothetical protein
MKEKPLVITCTLTRKCQVIQTHVLVNCKAMGNSSMDQDIACHSHMALNRLKSKIHGEMMYRTSTVFRFRAVRYFAKVHLMTVNPK